MKFSFVFFFVVLFSLTFTTVSSSQVQDTIYFMNGDILACKILDAKDVDVVFEFKKRKKVKSRAVHKSEIFAVVDDGVETVYYALNQITGDDLTEQEVEIFLAGERDAKNNFDTRLVFVVGAVSSFTLSALTGNGLVVKAIPILVYPALQLLPRIKIKQKTISDPNHRFNLIYADGYERVARGKKVLASLTSSFVGTVLGVVFYRLALD